MTAPWVSASRALMAGNFAIGCGVMVVAGSLNDLSASLQVSAAVAGQLITAGAVAMGLGAPLLVAVLARFDRRWLLTAALLWFAAGNALSALMPNYAALLPVRALAVLGAAVFTPQAAAAINVLAPPEQRGRAITTVFLGWSLSSVLGMPMHSYIGEAAGWRWAFAMVALLSMAAAWGVWRTVPEGVKPPTLNWASWGRVLTHPLLMGMVGVTLLSAAGQFTLFSYFAPYYRQVLGANATQVSLLFFWFGAFGLLGNVLLSRWIDRLGAARCVHIALVLMLVSLAAWPLTGPTGGALLLGGLFGGVLGMGAVLVPWALGCFSCNSAQQARLSQASAAYAPATLALNTSAIYGGQAIGAAGGGALLATQGFGPLPWAGLAWLVVALVLSVWVARRLRAQGGHV
ncbi:MFS transporter [Rubrivivax rivuli]|nr:MFS transporter [Rubrivivax rivuli]